MCSIFSIIYYCNVDCFYQVIVTLATLTFFCHRPTILAIIEFSNAINFVDEKDADKSMKEPSDSGTSDGQVEEPDSAVTQNPAIKGPAIKGLLGKGKSRVIFHLTLNMAKAQILLMIENGESLATLSQNNLQTDIKVCCRLL